VGVGGSTAADLNGRRTYVTGTAVLEAGWVDTELGRPGGRDLVRAVAMHELGHVMGLNHVKDRHEVMNASTGVSDWGPGDRHGLAALGHGPCT
jgi:predicted Zn-dependent protease